MSKSKVPWSTQRYRRFTLDKGTILLCLLGGLALVYLALPLVKFLLLEPWLSLPTTLSDPLATDALWTSVVSASCSTLFIAFFGIPLAYGLAHWQSRLRPLIMVLIYLPLVFPAVVSGIMQLLVYEPRGLIGALFAQYGLELDTSLAGVVLAQTFVAAPCCIVTTYTAFKAIDPDTEAAAKTSGADTLEIFFLISLPQAKDGVLAGLILTWLRAMGEFGATAVLAYHPYTLPVYIYVQLTGLGLSAALPVAFLAFLVSVVAVIGVLLTTVYKRR